jgi:tetratricopeptide (TPR) repeat protein
MLTRTYHQVTSRYNTYFNGKQSYRAGVRKAEQQFRYDFNKILPVFLYTDPGIASSISPDMDRAISKASKVITNKSITVKPNERRNISGRRNSDFYSKNEYNRWVKESYLLAGKAHFYKHDFFAATQAFLFIISEYRNHPVAWEARVWLARSYSEQGRYSEARMLFDNLLGDRSFPPALSGELYATIADFHLKQDEFTNALSNLEMALEMSGDKQTRIRYTFILAQLYERTGNNSMASDLYARVTRMNPPYEMVFNARLNQAGVFRASGGETARMVNDLERMLRDDKNRDYHDQIYYALGNFYQRHDNEEKAIEMYSRSAGAFGVNPSQKTVTYLALADIYFGYPDYITSAAYYDSAVINMNNDFPGQHALIEKNRILQDLVHNLNTFHLEDSLQLLASLTDAERNRKIDEIIARVRQDEADARQRDQLAQQTNQFQSARTSQAARYQAERTGGGNWYFYNQSAVTFGQNEFESLWGSRRLEDNWRRSSRQVLNPLQFAMAGDEDEIPGDTPQDLPDTGSREYYMRNIPLTDEAMQASHRRIQESLLAMAVIYNDDLGEYRLSAGAYEELIRRYPDGVYSVSALYELYSLHVAQQDHSEAERYKNLIISRYPGSTYASILTNPDYFREQEQQLLEAERYYERTFELFRESNYDQVIERAVSASRKWPESQLIPLFDYLSTLSFAQRGNIPLFRDMLSEYAAKYPETEMAENARQFISYLDDDYPEIIQMTEVAVIQDIYRPGQIGDHYFILVVDNIQDIINRLVFNIVNFNVDHFARLNLNITTEAFSTNYRVMRVEGLPDPSSALDYLNHFVSSEEVLAEAGKNDYPAFIISPENYELFMKDKNIGSYLNFFKGEYLER